METRRFVGIVILLAGMAVLAACGGGAEPTPTPTKTPAAQDQPATPTPTLAPVNVEPAPGQEQAAAPTNTPAPAAAPAVEKIGRVTADQLNIRSTPNTDGTIVKLALVGETFTVVSQSDDGQWLEVAEAGETLGWAAAEFMAVEERVADAPAGGEQAAQPPAEQPAGGFTGTFAPATMSSPDFGAQVFVWWREEIRDRDLDLMKEGGFNWIKQSFSWESIEGAGRGQFDWSIADKVVTHANERGLKILARLSLDPDKQGFWAGDPPASGDAFAEYAGALASRYNCQPLSLIHI